MEHKNKISDYNIILSEKLLVNDERYVVGNDGNAIDDVNDFGYKTYNEAERGFSCKNKTKVIKIPCVNTSENELPKYANPGDAGMDLRANIEKPITINTLERAIIPTGIHIQLPEGYEAQIRPRSGLAANHGISVCNTPGTIDSKFRDQIQVILINLSKEPFTINPGERIAQMVFKKFETVELVEVEELDMNGDRGGGLGHTGIK